MRDFQEKVFAVFAVFALALILLLPISAFTLYWGSDKNIEITIADKERVTSGTNSKYIIFTENEEYQVTDSWIYLDWRASSRYNKLKIGETCKVETIGWRWGFMSWYPNIVKVFECKDAE